MNSLILNLLLLWMWVILKIMEEKWSPNGGESICVGMRGMN